LKFILFLAHYIGLHVSLFKIQAAVTKTMTLIYFVCDFFVFSYSY